jgi:hypothetical protein
MDCKRGEYRGGRKSVEQPVASHCVLGREEHFHADTVRVKAISIARQGGKSREMDLLEPLAHLRAAVSGFHFQRAMGAAAGETEHDVARAPDCRSGRQEADGPDRSGPELKAITLFSHSIGIDAAAR